MQSMITTMLLSGAVRLSRQPDLWTPWQHNTVLYDWAAIAARLFAEGLQNYRISGLYVEFENVADPDDVVSTPAYGRDGGLDYYNNLSDDPSRDYLRVPLIASTISNSDETRYPAGNVVTFFGQTQGVVGVHGKPFSDANNSKVCGAALVAMVDEDDATRDLLMSRLYFLPANQMVKLASGQIGVEWRMTFE